MTAHSHFFRKLHRYFTSRKHLSTIGLLLVFLILYLLFVHRSQSTFMKDVYYVGEDNHWRDIQLYGKEKNFAAFTQDVLTAIAKEEKIRLKLINTRASDLEKQLLEDDFQGILSSMSPNEFKKRTYLFSEALYPLGPVLTVSTNTKIEGWNELARKIVGVNASSPTILNLQKDHSMQIKLYDDIIKAFNDLNDQKIDAVIFPVLPSLIYSRTFFPGSLKVTSLPLDDEGVHLVSLKNEHGEQLIKHFNNGLETIKKNGTYDALLKRWDLINTVQLE